MQKAKALRDIYQKRGSKGLPLERVYRHLFDPELFLHAYGKIYRNFGAMTPGATKETVDGMSLQRIHNIIGLLKHERYKWTPVRRTEIPKANGKTRPLGIPTWSDKLVQEVLRMLLAAYYEQRFSDHSHGFRPNRGCHTALREIREKWTGTVWFIEGDIKGCFDNIDHSVLLDIIRRDIHDGRLVKLIEGLLQAGYMEDWRHYDTPSGTPQGGILSPLLANIYLNELDQFVEDTLIPTYTIGDRRKWNPPYIRLTTRIATARRRRDFEEVKRLKRERRTVTRCGHLLSENGKRATNGNIALLMPQSVVHKYRSRFSKKGKIACRPELLANTDYTLVQQYQSVLRGIYNYYCLAVNVSRRMGFIKWILETSLTKTLAEKHKCSVTKIYRRYQVILPDFGDGTHKALRVVIERSGKDPLVALFGGIPFKRKPEGLGSVDFQVEQAWFAPSAKRSEVVQRLMAGRCELCEGEGPTVVPHLRKLVDIDRPGRRPKAVWEKIMTARKRKTLVVCKRCHNDIHAGKYDGPAL